MKQPTVKSKYVLNLNDRMVDSLITKVEAAIIEQKQQQSVIQPDLDEAKAMYEEVKSRYDVFQKAIDEEQQTLEALVRFKTAAPSSKTLQVYSNISNTHQKPKKTSPIKWQSEIQSYLRRTNEFVTPFVMMKSISKNVEYIREKNLSDAKLKVAMYYILDYTRKGKMPFVIKDDKIGLKEWLSADGTVSTAHLKEFMFHDQVYS